MDAAKLLDLDPEQVQFLAEAYEGAARSDSPNGREVPAWKRANDFAIAGSYWALSNPPHAWKLFSEAANLYFKSFLSRSDRRDQGFTSSPAWMFKAITLALSAADAGLVRDTLRAWSDQAERFLTPDLILAEMLAACFLGLQQRDDGFRRMYFEIDSVARSMPSHPVGRLGWPLRAYSQTTESLIERRAAGIDRSTFVRLFSPFADRLSDTIRSAQRSSYHWRRLYSRLLPIEPEAMAVCQIARRVLERQDLPPGEKRNAIAEFPSPARAYFEVAAESDP
jgi:hypothetical protein